MKKLLVFTILFTSVLFIGCKKDVSKVDVFKGNLKGVWHLNFARLSENDSWQDISDANDVFCIDDNQIYPYKDNYYVVDEFIISIPVGTNTRQNVVVSFDGNWMIFKFEDGSGFKLWQ